MELESFLFKGKPELERGWETVLQAFRYFPVVSLPTPLGAVMPGQVLQSPRLQPFRRLAQGVEVWLDLPLMGEGTERVTNTSLTAQPA